MQQKEDNIMNITSFGPQRPDILSIKLEDIRIDVRYQREPTTSRAKDIAKSFDERVAGRLTVNMRDDGTLWLLDGQHRFLAMKIKGIKEWGCDVLYGLTIEEEAKLFAQKNNLTRTATILERHHAKVIYKDPTAIAINDILHSIGLHVPKKSGVNTDGAVAAVGRLYELYSSIESGGLLKILTLLKITWGTRPKTYSESMISAVEMIMRRHPDQFREDRFIKQLSKLEPYVLMARAASLGGLEGCGANQAMYKIFVREYNRNLGAGAKLFMKEQ